METREELLLYLHDRLCKFSTSSKEKLTLEEFLNKYKVVRFTNGALAFATDVEADLNTQRYFIVGLNNSQFSRSVTADDLIRYNLLFPFMNIKLNIYDTYSSEWILTESIAKMLPTRKNLIDDLLATL